MVFLILLGIIAVVGLWVMGLYNGLVTLRNQVKGAWSQIDVQLKRRHDLIPNLVEVVKDYMSYEQETLEKVIKARNTAVAASGPAQVSAAENQLTGALRQMFAVFENYPDLKANQNVMKLQEELTSTENKIAFARQYFNDSVMTYNTKQELFPANLFAATLGFKKEEYYQVPEEEKQNVKVDLR
ncbi:MAG: LemA family protein [bacterium]|nr:LemA family protein [bacterium]MBK6912078.1 LemA family protein [bacterium]MBK8127372.1 LemA family protein [bacterium]